MQGTNYKDIPLRVVLRWQKFHARNPLSGAGFQVSLVLRLVLRVLDSVAHLLRSRCAPCCATCCDGNFFMPEIPCHAWDFGFRSCCTPCCTSCCAPVADLLR